MVFGNMGENCATGVAFTRNPSTGEKEFFGEYLINAQGEDVVAGTRTPQYISKKLKNESNSKNYVTVHLNKSSITIFSKSSVGSFVF